MPRLSPLRLVLAAGAVSALMGCEGLTTLKTVTQPTDLYDLTPKSTFDPSLPTISAQVVVEEPTAASSVNTDRIAVKPNPYQVQYFPDASWVDRAPLLVQTMLLESFENTGKVGAVGRQAIGLNADYTLVTDLREFQARSDTDGSAALEIVVQLNMKIVQEPRGLIVASRSFAYEAPSPTTQMTDVVEAFDVALGKTMGRAVDWAVRQIARIESDR
ncbi:MAG: ABC-type transport auxiliary lipoprotein family protein [Paracoccaceae bacterium]|nr:ABC-type transport auxiliary lipoprotein family protein [Paracoccaceae bacterium]